MLVFLELYKTAIIRRRLLRDDVRWPYIIYPRFLPSWSYTVDRSSPTHLQQLARGSRRLRSVPWFIVTTTAFYLPVASVHHTAAELQLLCSIYSCRFISVHNQTIPVLTEPSCVSVGYLRRGVVQWEYCLTEVPYNYSANSLKYLLQKYVLSHFVVAVLQLPLKWW